MKSAMQKHGKRQAQAEDDAYKYLSSRRPRALITRYAGALSRTRHYAETANDGIVRHMMHRVYDALAELKLHETIMSIGESCEPPVPEIE